MPYVRKTRGGYISGKKWIFNANTQIFKLHTIMCHHSCLQWNRLPHLVNSSVTSQTAE